MSVTNFSHELSRMNKCSHILSSKLYTEVCASPYSGWLHTHCSCMGLYFVFDCCQGSIHKPEMTTTVAWVAMHQFIVTQKDVGRDDRLDA